MPNMMTVNEHITSKLDFCQQAQQIRNKYADWRMIKDVKRRKTVKEFGAERMRINTLRKNDILPLELRVISNFTKMLRIPVQNKIL